ncbi:MAG: hypothetical protein WB463_08200 [Pseudolabrys sp.]
MTSRLSLYVFPALLAACALLTVTSSAGLPENVAIHFNAKNGADAWVARDQYRILMLSCLIGLPLLLVWLMAWLPRLTGEKGQIPDHEYWLATEQRDATKRFLLAHSCWLGTITVAIIYGIQLSIQRANAAVPATLATDQLSTVLLIYICGLAWWIASFLRHFNRGRGDRDY